MDSKMQKMANIIGYLIGGILVSLAGIAVIAIIDGLNIDNGNVYHTKAEAEQALERKLAEVRLRRTSNFEPDFKNGKGGWIVYYDHGCETLAVCDFDYYDAGEPVRYATREEAEKSIEKNRADWLAYFGVKEWE